MCCTIGDALKGKLATATLAVGRYAESLEGVARIDEHRQEIERLEREQMEAISAFLDHKGRCAECRPIGSNQPLGLELISHH